jgi:phosphatidate cytidylyltransferase
MTESASVSPPEKKGLSNTLVRILTALVLAPLILLLVTWENHLGLWLFVLAFNAIAYWEMLGMVPGGSDAVDKVVVLGLGLGFSAGLYWAPDHALVLAASAVVVLMSYAVFRFRDMETVGPRVAYWLTTIFYCGVLFTCLALLKRLNLEGDWVLLAMTTSWFADTGAYFTGRAIGGPKIYPAVSPKKTISGATGGLLASLGAGVLAKLWYMPQLGWVDVALLCVPGGVLGQVGDFAESLLKRSFGVKDSGAILPGHGGVLDRVDALMYVSAYFVVYATVVFGR